MNMHVKAEGKFKVGDRVRCVDAAGTHVIVAGETYTVEGVSGQYINVNGGNGMWASRFELATKFAAGDKVRVVKDGDEFGGSHHECPIGRVVTMNTTPTPNGISTSTKSNPLQLPRATAPTPPAPRPKSDNLADEYGGRKAETKFVAGDRVRAVDGTCLLEIGTEHVVTKANDKDVWIDIDTGNKVRNLSYPHNYFVAVAPATATTLRIEAGKFYKTRDGRKVGPMVWRNGYGGNHPWIGTLDKPHRDQTNNFIFKVDGSNYEFTNLDLIDEWTDDVPLLGVSPVVAPATTATFKVGDRVKFRDDYNSPARGKEATVINVDTWGIQVDQGGHSWDGLSTEQPSDLVLLPSVTTIADIVAKHSQTGTAIVAVLENGTPRPNTRPFVHNTTDAATTEANRLARTNHGKEFGVYTLGTVAKVDRVYDHEWQRLAARGSKIPAIKALRDLAGVDLAAAKTGVEQFLMRAA
ncbi:hypothetical protein LB559_09075 [Mesorhizobium sp. BR1-1-3]|uniref:hypothetical protein n=1 Tax=Mesorhizobium sp. BR1-1-3 TaxID=2876651 RepID=UPI001CD0D6B2|nr:hypothetical protein [Mesorhizobium sp. BR1-1-3]MBZ9888090.1 hypothetical protein [Mesorhizobium sp. BR1-1-3]